MVVGLENESEPTSVIVQRLLEDGQNVPMKLENLETPIWFDADKFKRLVVSFNQCKSSK